MIIKQVVLCVGCILWVLENGTLIGSYGQYHLEYVCRFLYICFIDKLRYYPSVLMEKIDIEKIVLLEWILSKSWAFSL